MAWNSCIYQPQIIPLFVSEFKQKGSQALAIIYNSKAILGVKLGISFVLSSYFTLPQGVMSKKLHVFFTTPTLLVSSPSWVSDPSCLSSQLDLLLSFIFRATIFILLFSKWWVSREIYYALVRGNHAWNSCYFQVAEAVF